MDVLIPGSGWQLKMKKKSLGLLSPPPPPVPKVRNDAHVFHQLLISYRSEDCLPQTSTPKGKPASPSLSLSTRMDSAALSAAVATIESLFGLASKNRIKREAE
ncbi:hypothetical protein CDAR_508611 [Caerostris darwini]|uniref:Uncharacterized protein n=1 Tax=Caerostris darwini TaxID=1538125 RepID=A0AAV4N0E6_9ARAC|nr:hypothetical protein CDAR_508611 [Caerostris darwini]